MSTSANSQSLSTPKRQLNWFDSTSIIVGTIIGSGIYQMASGVASSVTSAWALLGLWLLGGLFSLCGAVCYAELASALPRSGGDYVYLNRAYGNWAGFVFGWLQMLVIRPGDIAIISFAFATYFQAFFESHGNATNGWTASYAAMAVTVLTLVNILGVRQGKSVQNLLTSLKVIGLLGIIAIAFFAPSPKLDLATTRATATSTTMDSLPIGVALIFVLFTFGGWNEMAYIAAEVKHPERNMVRSLVSGTLIVTLLYLMINAAFLRVLGLERMGHSPAIATETVEVIFPEYGGRLVSLLICISTLGTANGMIFTGSRISYALGTDHRVFRLLGRWESQTETPVIALVVQGMITIALILMLGSFISAVLYTSAAVYTFYLATGIAVAVLRKTAPNLERPYRVTFYPIPLCIFSGMCLFLVYSAILYQPRMAGIVGILGLFGLAIYWLEKKALVSHLD